VGSDEDVLGSEVRHGLDEVGGRREAEVVVGLDALYARDSEAGETRGGLEWECCAGRAFCVGENLGAGEPAVVVDE
jgi:hypothetical protein